MIADISTAKDSIAAIKRDYKGVDGIFLPAHIVGYIASIFKATYDATLLLNLYKAFESIAYEGGTEDPLADYKNLIQNYIFRLAISRDFGFDPDYDLALGENIYGLTRREFMYLFDITNCVPTDIMYGVEPKNSHRKWIDDELADCTHFTENFGTSRNLRYGVFDAIDIMLYKHTRLLEEALRTKSYGLLNYMSHQQMIYPDMLSYIYIKNNNIRYAPSEDFLTNNDLWFNLLLEYNMLDIVLGVAIGGLREHVVYSVNALNNVVRPNLAMVKKIVPRYIRASDEVRCPYPISNVSNYDYSWCFNMKVELYCLGDEAKTFPVENDREIAAYLKSCL